MLLQDIVIVRKPLNSRLRNFYLGAGVVVNIKTCQNSPLITFLKEEFIKNPDSLAGDIRSLLTWKPASDQTQ